MTTEARERLHRQGIDRDSVDVIRRQLVREGDIEGLRELEAVLREKGPSWIVPRKKVCADIINFGHDLNSAEIWRYDKLADDVDFGRVLDRYDVHTLPSLYRHTEGTRKKYAILCRLIPDFRVRVRTIAGCHYSPSFSFRRVANLMSLHWPDENTAEITYQHIQQERDAPYTVLAQVYLTLTRDGHPVEHGRPTYGWMPASVPECFSCGCRYVHSGGYLETKCDVCGSLPIDFTAVPKRRQ